MQNAPNITPISPKVTDLFKTVLDILVIAVLSDDRTRDRERIEFIHCAQVHNRALHPDIILTPVQIRHLFDERVRVLSAQINADGLRSVQEHYLSMIIDRGVQRSVLASIFAIAICDYELHDEERGMIKSALKVWNSHLPDPAEIDPVS
ncbi:hypothetical protein [Fretibacter rubidus]|uniref:hypothetical protein n=1 Tax=Fretibacter rubidus TaxID=570162 RepID=UPI00352A6C88